MPQAPKNNKLSLKDINSIIESIEQLTIRYPLDEAFKHSLMLYENIKSDRQFRRNKCY